MDDRVDARAREDTEKISALERQVLNVLWGSVITEFTVDEGKLNIVKQVPWSEVARDNTSQNNTLNF